MAYEGMTYEKIITKMAGGVPGWTATYSDKLRLVTVRDTSGNIIGQRDPFYPVGIPATPARREARIREVAKQLVKEYRRKQYL